MRLCIPTRDDSGRQAQLSEHFGRAPYYTVVDTDDSSVEVVENESDHYGGATQPPVFVANLDVDAVVVEEVGERSMSVFERRGIDVYRANQTDVESMVDAFERGVLPELDADDVHPSGHHDAE
jgi:predicted Fe-Mo cluster-binding NifX family protein